MSGILVTMAVRKLRMLCSCQPRARCISARLAPLGPSSNAMAICFLVSGPRRPRPGAVFVFAVPGDSVFGLTDPVGHSGFHGPGTAPVARCFHCLKPGRAPSRAGRPMKLIRSAVYRQCRSVWPRSAVEKARRSPVSQMLSRSKIYGIWREYKMMVESSSPFRSTTQSRDFQRLH